MILPLTVIFYMKNVRLILISCNYETTLDEFLILLILQGYLSQFHIRK